LIPKNKLGFQGAEMPMKKHKAKSPTDLDAVIGQRIRKARHLRGWSQEDLAQRLGVTFQQLQKYENAANRVTASRLYQIAKILNLPVAYFFGERNVIPKKLEFAFDEDSADLLAKFRPLSKPKRKIIRDLLVQLAKAA
jgi:transcriptional regulator with XRE-family HTH domain